MDQRLLQTAHDLLRLLDGHRQLALCQRLHLQIFRNMYDRPSAHRSGRPAHHQSKIRRRRDAVFATDGGERGLHHVFGAGTLHGLLHVHHPGSGQSGVRIRGALLRKTIFQRDDRTGIFHVRVLGIGRHSDRPRLQGTGPLGHRRAQKKRTKIRRSAPDGQLARRLLRRRGGVRLGRFPQRSRDRRQIRARTARDRARRKDLAAQSPLLHQAHDPRRGALHESHLYETDRLRKYRGSHLHRDQESIRLEHQRSRLSASPQRHISHPRVRLRRLALPILRRPLSRPPLPRHNHGRHALPRRRHRPHLL
mmetsp:Transcript_34584/g.79966  ORF Transcript_34584/g.79966 Transcript_34584/m.79966 type:complete len:307 (-) Transcript_34584:497-1417(-)